MRLDKEEDKKQTARTREKTCGPKAEGMGLKYPAALRRPHRERFLLVTATAALLLYITVTVTVLQSASQQFGTSRCAELPVSLERPQLAALGEITGNAVNPRRGRISALPLFLGSLPEGRFPARAGEDEETLGGHRGPPSQPGPPAEADAVRRDPPLSPCPGHRFQVSQLLSHLHSALGPDGDVLLQPYLSSWDELLKFMESLGPVTGFISQQVEHKASVIRRLAQREEAAEGDAYRSLFLKKVAEGPQEGGELRSPSSLCREAYREALAHHHSWLARRAADVAFMALPDRDALFQLVCARSQGEAGPLLDRAAEAIGEVYGRTQKAFEEHGMLELP
ncbi:glycolipid transfer protein domain-containing protein 1-like [Scleropages formosus]|uniref:Glycolipid transfer protein domain-containing protein 1-like n=1 Tax=Scleropages formosus TaxID=113540 RepID=A0A0N8JVM3_SCLFO|nr:glycolipid transfer protein domain-containing protein 1-like [Scleropages formosus]